MEDSIVHFLILIGCTCFIAYLLFIRVQNLEDYSINRGGTSCDDEILKEFLKLHDVVE